MTSEALLHGQRLGYIDRRRSLRPVAPAPVPINFEALGKETEEAGSKFLDLAQDFASALLNSCPRRTSWDRRPDPALYRFFLHVGRGHGRKQCGVIETKGQLIPDANTAFGPCHVGDHVAA